MKQEHEVTIAARPAVSPLLDWQPEVSRGLVNIFKTLKTYQNGNLKILNETIHTYSYILSQYCENKRKNNKSNL